VTAGGRHADAAAVGSEEFPPLERVMDRIPFVEKELLLLRALVRPGDVCLDVGAAGGAHLLVMASATGPGGHVLAVEPRPGSYRVLRTLVRASGLGARITLANTALAATDGTVGLRIPVVPTRAHLHGSTSDHGSEAAFPGLPHREIEVPMRRLDDLVVQAGLTRVDVLKCDVEGAELLVLAGATRILREHRPVVIVEADDLHQRRFDATAQDVLDAVVAAGYRAHRYRDGALDEVAGVVPGEDDYVLVPDGRELPVPIRSLVRAAA
jgi:FkbM family methyltransferase